MGGDGGATVSRDIIVGKQQKRGLVQDIRLTNLGKYTNCAMSGLVLKQPIVACELGGLYNYEEVLKFLLEINAMKTNPKNYQELNQQEKIARTIFEDKQIIFYHLTKNSDLIQCKTILSDSIKNLEKNKDKNQKVQQIAVSNTSNGIGTQQDITNYILCPITQLPANGSIQFIVMRHCGCVLSEKGFEQINGAEQRVAVLKVKNDKNNPNGGQNDKQHGNSNKNDNDDGNGETEMVRACCLCLKPLPDRYQDGWTVSTDDGDDNDNEPNNNESDKKNKKQSKTKTKTNKSNREENLLKKFPLQFGEKFWIPLIPNEEDKKILQDNLNAKFKFLGRPLAADLQSIIKRQRVAMIDNSEDAQRLVQLEPLSEIGIVKK